MTVLFIKSTFTWLVNSCLKSTNNNQFNGPLSGTTQVSPYQENIHSATLFMGNIEHF